MGQILTNCIHYSSGHLKKTVYYNTIRASAGKLKNSSCTVHVFHAFINDEK